jgi:uncharacterized protein
MNLSLADKQLIQKFFASKPVKKAFLFGSFARKEAKEKSDIDILVELDYSKQIGMRFFSYKDELEELLNRNVDLVTSDGLSRHIKPYIDKDKVLIYER